MWLIHCRERSTGRGHATVYCLSLHDEIMTYGLSYTSWLKARRPADVKPKGSPPEPFSDPWEGSGPRPFSEIKGLGPQAKGSPNGSQRVSTETAPGFTPEKISRSEERRVGKERRS